MTPSCVRYVVLLLAIISLIDRTEARTVSTNPAAKSMNVLYLLADDMRADWGSYGLPVHTPNLDQLVSEGLRFQRAYCQISVCSPSRQSFLTSKRPDTNQVWNFLDANPLSTQATPGHFRDNGYLSLGLGKTFHEAGGSWNQEAYWNTTVKPYFHYGFNTCSIGAAGGGQCIKADEDIYDYSLRLKAVEYLRYAAQNYKNTSQPFFVMAGFRDPHAPWVAPQRMYDLYDEDSIKGPTQKVLGTGTPLIAWSHQLDVCLANGTSFPFSYDKAVPDWVQRNQRHAYYAAVSYVDEHVGAILQVLEDESVVDDTIVIFHADHGYSLGEHGYWEKKSNLDLTVRVPLVVKVPGVTDSPGFDHATSALFDLVDVFPTLAALANLPPPAGVDGIDQSGVVVGGKPLRTAAYHQYPACGTASFNSTRLGCNGVASKDFDFMGYSIRTDSWRYTAWYHWDQTELVALWDGEFVEELYDHAGDDSTDLDKWENVNLAASNTGVASSLRRELLQFFQTGGR